MFAQTFDAYKANYMPLYYTIFLLKIKNLIFTSTSNRFLIISQYLSQYLFTKLLSLFVDSLVL